MLLSQYMYNIYKASVSPGSVQQIMPYLSGALYNTHNNKNKMRFTWLGTQQQRTEARCGCSCLQFTVHTESVIKEEHINMKLKQMRCSLQIVKWSQPQLSMDCNTWLPNNLPRHFWLKIRVITACYWILSLICPKVFQVVSFILVFQL
jgi:hypothetical protein